MYKRILVALDGSQISEGVLPYARSFAKGLKIPVELLHVADPDTLIPPLLAKPGRHYDVLTAERKDRSEYLKEVGASFPDPKEVDCSVRIGKASEMIVDSAAAYADTLIAMATHGHSGVKRWLLGSVADKVLHATASPLLLVRTTEEMKGSETRLLRTVLLPLDGSELAEKAIPEVVELAREMDLEIVLVRVYALATPAHADSYTPNLEQLWEQIRKEAEDYLGEKARQLQGQGFGKVSTVSVEGDAAEKIIDLARERPQSLVAMCSHGRTGVGRWVLGSVTDRVVRHSGDPVLIIPASTKG